jgi:predicted porin
MKKTLVAIAAVLASAGAMAQSNVTIYGIADLVVHKDKGASMQMTNGGVSASRWGITGAEDLGGGLKASFKFEQGLSLENGSTGAGFNREASLGLSGGFGMVKFGHFSTAFDTNEGAGFAAFYSVLNPAWEWTTYSNARHDNGIYYASPEFGGFSVDASVNLEEGVANSRHTAVVLKYSSGPLYAAFLTQDDKSVAEKQSRVELSYDLGFAKALFAYDTFDAAGEDTKQYTIGADVPMSDSLTLSGGFSSTKTDAAARINGWSLAAAYSLSKRTTVYGGLYGDNGAAGTTLKSRYGAGIKHTF